MFSVASVILISTPTVPEGTPAAMREYLNLPPAAETDAFLSALFLRAAGVVEARTGVTLLPASYQVKITGAGSSARLPLFPVASVLSVVDADGVQADFTLNPEPGCFYRLDFPAPLSGTYTATVKAGYEAPAVLPPVASAAIFAVAADLYEHREYEQEGSLTESRAARMAIDALTFLHAGGV